MNVLTRCSCLFGWIAAALLAVGPGCSRPAAAAPDPAKPAYGVTVEIENVSGEKKTDWPVIMTVYRLLGRNLPKGSLNPKGYHVYDPSGKEVAYAVDEIPPYEVPGNDELIFVVPTMEAGAKLVYRVTNTAEDSAKKMALDILGNPNNLLSNAGFEKGDDKSVEGYSGQARLDREIKHSGGASMLLAGNKAMSVQYVKPITLHPNSWYYFGTWSKTDNVTRGSYATGSKGGVVTVTGFNGKDPEVRVQSQCGNRDWNKSRWFARHELSRTDWGMDEQCVQATDTNCTVKIVLDQRKLFIMDKDLGKWWLDDAMFFEQPKVTVRFDQALAPRVKDGCFLFYRPPSGPFGDMKGNDKRGLRPWGAMPYAHEAIDHLNRFGLKGQRVPFFFEVYHEKPLDNVTVQVENNALAGPEGTKLAPEWIEYSHGYIGSVPHCNLMDMNGAVSFAEPKGICFFNVTFNVPRDAKPGVYRGKIRLLTEGEKTLADIPVSLAVQDLELPIVRDHYFGYIFQGGYSEAAVRLYARSGFTSVTIFDGFLKYKKNEQGQQEVDLVDLESKMKMLAGLGIAGVNPFSDFDLGPMWNGGSLFRKSGGKPKDPATKKNFQREVLRIEEACKQHPEWPRMIYMTWDEPEPGGGWQGGSNGKEHGGPNEIMGWVNEVAPQALTTLDCMFPLLPVVDKYYTMPCLDDPVDYACPELFDYYRKRNKDFGMASAGGPGEASRQIGIKMITSGARYCHTWHVWSGMMDRVDKKPYRSVYMVAAGQGMDDYRVWRLLTDSIKEAQASGNATAKAKAEEAEAYVARVCACMNGDMADGSGGPPYLGRAYTWGYEQFYDDWQEQMAKFAAALKGVKWVE